MARHHLAAGGEDGDGDALAQIFFERLDDFGLRPIALDDDLARFFDARERRVDDLLADAAGEGFGFDPGKELGKGRAGRLLRGQQRRDEQQEHSHVHIIRRWGAGVQAIEKG